jgi:hypothetical protein
MPNIDLMQMYNFMKTGHVRQRSNTSGGWKRRKLKGEYG